MIDNNKMLKIKYSIEKQAQIVYGISISTQLLPVFEERYPDNDLLRQLIDELQNWEQICILDVDKLLELADNVREFASVQLCDICSYPAVHIAGAIVEMVYEILDDVSNVRYSEQIANAINEIDRYIVNA